MTHFAGEATLTRQQFVARVAANVLLCREHWRLVLALPTFPATEAGQFVQLACRGFEKPEQAPTPELELEWSGDSPRPISLGVSSEHADELIEPVAFLRRPFSLAGRTGRPDGGVELEVIHRVVGVGTDWLARRRVGDAVGVLGPLG